MVYQKQKRLNRRKPLRFYNLNNEETTYWLGFLFADGTIMPSKGGIRLVLQPKDKKHLQKFADFTDREIKEIQTTLKSTGKTYKQLAVNYYSQNDLDFLMSLGLVPHRCKNEVGIPSCILDNRIKHFIRGFFDGDGSIQYNESHNGYKRLVCNIHNGSRQLLLDIKHILKNITDTQWNIHKDKRSPVYYISCSGNKACKKLYDYFYYDANIFLERKKQIFDKVFFHEN